MGGAFVEGPAGGPVRRSGRGPVRTEACEFFESVRERGWCAQSDIDAANGLH